MNRALHLRHRRPTLATLAACLALAAPAWAGFNVHEGGAGVFVQAGAYGQAFDIVGPEFSAAPQSSQSGFADGVAVVVPPGYTTWGFSAAGSASVQALSTGTALFVTGDIPYQSNAVALADLQAGTLKLAASAVFLQASNDELISGLVTSTALMAEDFQVVIPSSYSGPRELSFSMAIDGHIQAGSGQTGVRAWMRAVGGGSDTDARAESELYLSDEGAVAGLLSIRFLLSQPDGGSDCLTTAASCTYSFSVAGSLGTSSGVSNSLLLPGSSVDFLNTARLGYGALPDGFALTGLSGTNWEVSPVPEPGALGLMLLGLGAVAARAGRAARP